MASDPNGWVKNPPSQIVKIANVTSKEELNGQLALVLAYQSDKERYVVVPCLQPTASQLLLKATNLQAASFLDKFRGQFQLIQNHPQVAGQIQHYVTQAEQLTGLSIRNVAIAAGALLVTLGYFLGFSRTLLLISFVLMMAMVIGPDVQAMRSSSTASTSTKVVQVVRNIPSRVQSLLRAQSNPIMDKIANSPILLNVFILVVVGVFVMGMGILPQKAVAKSAPTAGLWSSFRNPFSSSTPSSTTTVSSADREQWYKLGYEDAKADHAYGHSLPAKQETTVKADRDWEADIDLSSSSTLGPPPGPTKSTMSKFMSMSNIMSMMYLYRMAMELGKDPIDPSRPWDPQRAIAQARTMEVWKLGLLGMAVYRIVSSVM